MNAPRQLDHVCRPPALAGQACEGLVCEGYAFQDDVVSTANVTYLKFGGAWHRLCFDPGAVHWRTCDTAPEPWAIPAAGLSYPHTDVALLAGVHGVPLTSYCIAADSSGIMATFDFENGRSIIIRYQDERASFAVV